jgi:hypothetical protein
MTRKTGIAMAAAFALTAVFTLGTARAALDVSGEYQLTAAGDYFTRSVVHLHQEGSTVIGDYEPYGSLHGTMKDNILSATWNDRRGQGWLTFKFKLDSSGFEGDWGFNGKKPSGQLIGKKLADSLPPAAPAAPQ